MKGVIHVNSNSLSHTKWNCKYHIVFAPKYSVSEIMGYLKGKSSLMIFDRHAHLKYKYGNRNFWCRGYYVDTVGKNTKKIKEYIQNQLKEDYTKDQISIKEYMDPFTGEKTKM
ncbi:TPA: IS200/IS605 family transposase [Enterococcus faecalis]|nr:IS200/IS605 family transposase [Enterococcus faecalis]